MPYKKRGKRQQLLDLARKSRERAQAKRAAKTKAVSRANRLISGAPPKTAATKSPARKSQPPARKSQGRVIPKDVTRRTTKPSATKPLTRAVSGAVAGSRAGKQKAKPVQLRPKGRAGGGMPGGRKGFLGIKNLTADKYKQARLRAEGKRMASDLPMKIPGSMSVKTAEKIGKPLEYGGDVLLLLTGFPGFANFARKYGAKSLVTKSGAIKGWIKDKLKAKKNPFKDLSGSKGRQGYKEPIGPSAPKPTPKAKGKQPDAHVKAYKRDKVKQGRLKAEQKRKEAVASAKRQREARRKAEERADSTKTETGYAQQRIDARERSRKAASPKLPATKKPAAKKKAVEKSVPPAKRYPVKEYTDTWKKQQKKKATKKRVERMYGKDNQNPKPIKKAVKKRRQRQKGGQQLVKKAAKKPTKKPAAPGSAAYKKAQKAIEEVYKKAAKKKRK